MESKQYMKTEWEKIWKHKEGNKNNGRKNREQNPTYIFGI